MATSCGSPCYAAPELVINDENNYVGTAVDIWSCGVILFAMLCGYLPYDDDPSNPQGANINVLYKYILSTPLEIPKHASEDATDLLRIMLVPDPSKRCSIDQIRAHPWLQDHRDLLNKDHMTPRSAVEEEAIIDPQHHLSEPEPPRDPSPSFLQAKFISSLNTTTTTQRPASVPFNKIPNRSQSVQQQPSNRERTNSEGHRHSPPPPPLVHIMPSVSEQTVSPKTVVNKTNRQKLMDWFKRKPSSQSNNTFYINSLFFTNLT